MLLVWLGEWQAGCLPSSYCPLIHWSSWQAAAPPPRTSPLRSPALALLAAMHHRFAGLVPTARPALPPIHGGVVGRSYPPVHRSLALRLAPFASASVRRACRPLAVSAQSTSLRSLRISLCPLYFLKFSYLYFLANWTCGKTLGYDRVIYLVHGIEASVNALEHLPWEFCSYSERGSTNFAHLVAVTAHTSIAVSM
jgi:hypothetical protein